MVSLLHAAAVVKVMLLEFILGDAPEPYFESVLETVVLLLIVYLSG